MDGLLNLNADNDYSKWYLNYRSSFMFIGTEFGYTSEEISDFIHQFFLDLLEKKIDPETIQNPKAYLTVAFRRKLIDQYRRNRKTSLVSLDDGNISNLELSAQDKLEIAEKDKELVRSIRKAYEKLPKRCKIVINLKFYNGLNTDEIAEQTGLSKRSVYNNLYEGIKMLRSELQQKHSFKEMPVSLILPLIFLGII